MRYPESSIHRRAHTQCCFGSRGVRSRSRQGRASPLPQTISQQPISTLFGSQDAISTMPGYGTPPLKRVVEGSANLAGGEVARPTRLTTKRPHFSVAGIPHCLASTRFP